jgi:hypothetical protein
VRKKKGVNEKKTEERDKMNFLLIYILFLVDISCNNLSSKKIFCWPAIFLNKVKDGKKTSFSSNLSNKKSKNN